MTIVKCTSIGRFALCAFRFRWVVALLADVVPDQASLSAINQRKCVKEKRERRDSGGKDDAIK